MRKMLIVLTFVWGCSETDILKQDARDLNAAEKAKLITKLWQRCEQGVSDAQAVAVDAAVSASKVPQERVRVGEERIRILEEALPYGRRAFELAPLTARDCTYWFALCASSLGWEYDFVGQVQVSQGKERGDAALVTTGEENREKAKPMLKTAIEVLRHYVRVYYDRAPNVMIFEWLEINHELLGDLPNAYLVAREMLRRLEGLKRGGVNAAEVDPWIERYKTVCKKLEDEMRKRLIPIPKVRDEAPSAPR